MAPAWTTGLKSKNSLPLDTRNRGRAKKEGMWWRKKRVRTKGLQQQREQASIISGSTLILLAIKGTPEMQAVTTVFELSRKNSICLCYENLLQPRPGIPHSALQLCPETQSGTLNSYSMRRRVLKDRVPIETGIRERVPVNAYLSMFHKTLKSQSMAGNK